MEKKQKINQFREHIESLYEYAPTHCGGGFGEILCYKLHNQPINPRMSNNTFTGFCTGLTFRELADKWGISISFLGELIADHCEKLGGV